MCIIIFFSKSKQHSHNSDDTHHFSLTINKIPPTFQEQINSLTSQLRHVQKLKHITRKHKNKKVTQ